MNAKRDYYEVLGVERTAEANISDGNVMQEA